MRSFKKSSFLLLSILVGCSTSPTEKKEVVVSDQHALRHIASINEILNDPAKIKARMDKLMTGIFHAYMMGQVHIQSFDDILKKRPAAAMKSDAYSSLLAIRTFVDQFEHDMNDLYIGMVLAAALPEYTAEQKMNAEIGLKAMGEYLDGVKSDRKVLPENLKPLILSNLREKQTALFEDLKEFHDQHNDPNVKSTIHKHMVLLRATRMSYFKELKNYFVDPAVFAKTLREEKKKKSFIELEKEVKELSQEMKVLISELGRGTSSEAIVPSTGPNGNLTGRNFPKRTWSLTYDDGPGKTTTEQVVHNLVERNIPATFFMLAKQVEAYPKTALKVKEAGMDLASHSYTHAQLTKVGATQLEREIGTAKKVIEEKLDTKIKLFRLPYGAGVSVSNVRSKIANHGLIHVFWNVDTLDWQDKNPQSILNRAIRQMKGSPNNSGIILFHDIHPQSVKASTMLMDHFNKEKLTICTVQAVVNQMNENLPSCK